MSTGRNRDSQRADFSGFPARLDELADVGLNLFPRRENTNPPGVPHALADTPDGPFRLGQPHVPSGDQSEFLKLARAL